MRIISFDPGGTTGVAIYDDEFYDPDNLKAAWSRFELGPGDHHGELWVALTLETEVVYETFEYQRRDITKGVSLELVSREYIGIIKLHKEMQEDDGEPINLHPQKPSQRMFWTDDKLRELDLWVSSPHERDATRHLLYYISFTLSDDRFLMKLH